jgi:hypothetical protein
MINVDQMLAIASHKASDRMRRAVGRTGQAGQTAIQIVFWPRRKRTRTDRLHQQDASARWRCPREGNSYATGAYTYSLYI